MGSARQILKVRSICFNMANNIQYEATVNGILYRLARTEEIEQLEDFWWKTYMTDEAVAKALKYDLVNRDPVTVMIFKQMIDQGLSLIAMDPSKDPGKNIIGMRKNGVFTKNGEIAKMMKEKLPELTAQMQVEHKHNMMMLQLMGTPDIVLKANAGHEKMFIFAGLAVHSDYRGRGIAKELVKQSIQVGRMIGCDCVYSPASHDATRKIYADFGLKEILRLSRVEIEEKLGTKIFRTDDIQFMTAHFMSLK